MNSRALMIVAATAMILTLTVCDKGPIASPEPSTSILPDAASGAEPDAAAGSEAVFKPGYTDVVTEVSQPIAISGLGPFAPFSGPAVAGDGTVYLADMSGRLTALRWDGSVAWRRSDPSPNFTFEVSPVVGIDGTVYALGTPTATRDHRSGASSSSVYGATLFRFTPGGGLLGTVELPKVDQQGPRDVGQPSVWRVGAEEVLVVTALYQRRYGDEIHLFAISPSGEVLDDWSVFHVYEVSGEYGGWDPFPEFTPGRFAPPERPPFQGAVVGPGLRASPASIVFADVRDDQVYSFIYCTPATCDSQRGFVQIGSPVKVEDQEICSAPTIIRPPSTDTYSALGVDGGVTFAGPSTKSQPTLKTGRDDICAPPTILSDGRLLAVDVMGVAIRFVQGAVESRVDLSDQTMAQPAASQTHVFISTVEAFRVLDATGSTVLSTHNRLGGGTRAPVISPHGHVYDLTRDTLYIHPRVRNGQPYIDPQDFQIG